MRDKQGGGGGGLHMTPDPWRVQCTDVRLVRNIMLEQGYSGNRVEAASAGKRILRGASGHSKQ
jgi:hypothetical protein